MDMIDLDKLDTANKGIVVAFIILIVCINILLIYKTIRKGGFIYKPQSMILISLAIGDIILALFSLVVKAVTIYQGTIIFTNCDLYKTSEVYITYLIHFVYSVGLILLSVELVLQYKYQHTSSDTRNDTVRAIVFSALPWVLGLVIVLPLTMAGTTDTSYDYGIPASCFGNTSQERVIAMNVVSVILPATLAVIVTFIVMCMNLLSPTPNSFSYTRTIDEKNPIPMNTAAPPHNYPIHAQNSGMANPSKQKIVLFVTAFVFSQCVTPLAVLNILRAYFMMWPVDVVLYSAFLWLVSFRSVITPCIFIGCSRN